MVKGLLVFFMFYISICFSVFFIFYFLKFFSIFFKFSEFVFDFCMYFYFSFIFFIAPWFSFISFNFFQFSWNILCFSLLFGFPYIQSMFGSIGVQKNYRTYVDFCVRQVRFLFSLGHPFETFRSVPKNVRTAEGAKLLTICCSFGRIGVQKNCRKYVDFGVRQVFFFFNLGHHFGTFRSVPKNVRTADGAKYLANFCSKNILFLKHFFDADLSGSEVFKKRFEAEAKTCPKSSVPPRSRCFFIDF